MSKSAEPAVRSPLLFDPIYKEKVWGGRAMEKLGRDLPGGSETPIGESWELADLGQTSPSGGGGKAERSVVAEGPLSGLTLHHLIEQQPRTVLGNLSLNPFGEFPLLVKFLDARENLSVQVHPSTEYAAKHEDAFLKSEAWYVVAAEPDACIYKGVQPDVTPEQFRQALRTNTRQAVEPLMIRVPVEPGDCHYLPSGTCHALGGGVLVAEVQTPSDTTFRVFDWGRTGRELHIEQAMQCIHFGPPDTAESEKRTEIVNDEVHRVTLCRCPYFQIDRVRSRRAHVTPVSPGQPLVWMMLKGEARFTGEEYGEQVLPQGRTALLAAGLAPSEYEMPEDAVYLETSFPEAAAGPGTRLAEQA